MTFDDFHFEPEINEGLVAMGFEKPTPIQEQTIPPILDNKDMIGCAQTGTGKTAAYLLPIINKMIRNANWGSHISTLIIVPTRELALQIDQQLSGFAYFAPISSISVYGGNDSSLWDQQKKAMVKGVDIVIATPGRLLSHINLGYVNFDDLQHLVLDEADRMLDMGFYDDIMKIINYLPKSRQTLLFSATMPPKIRELT
ncbi:MAG: DEAD/DEAH box helicase, partial [Bacteroidota bacterium]|nr:DEAD/DEAH box helicase [Bacteroidota bacterium]